MLQNSDYVPLRTTETRIGSTTYVVTSYCRTDSKENAAAKMKRIIENEIQVKKGTSISMQ